MTGANGPCGSAPCYTPAQATSCGGATLTRTRIVIGQIIGASNFDVGHIGLGEPRRRRGEPRRRRRQQQGAGLHRALDAGRRLLRRRLRGARDRPPVRRQPHASTARSRTAPAATAARPTRSSPAAARRSWPTPASASRTISSRTATRTGRSAASRRSRPSSPANRPPINEVQNVSLTRLLRRQRDADVPADRLRRHRLVPARSTWGTCRRRS